MAPLFSKADLIK